MGNNLLMYYVYILHCRDNSLYTGITNSLSQRIKLHREGKGSKYVRSRLPVKLIHSEAYSDKSSAMKREWQIKGWSREEKIRKLELNLRADTSI